jgi:hypothetical protein
MSLVRAVRALTWKQWAWATAIPIAIAMTVPVQNFHQNWYWAMWRFAFSVPWYLLFSYTVLLAIAIMEPPGGAYAKTPAWRYVASLVAASAMYAAALATFPELYRFAPREIRSGQELAADTFADAGQRARKHRSRVMASIPSTLAYGWIATFVYMRLRNARRAARALADAEIERSEAQRKLLAAQLVAAHAQVDPAFVLQRLEAVERAYEADPARADVLLDEFIAFLRDAIPRLREDGVDAT